MGVVRVLVVVNIVLGIVLCVLDMMANGRGQVPAMENAIGKLISMVMNMMDLVNQMHTLIVILPSPILIMNIVPAGRSAQIVGVRDVSVLCRVIRNVYDDAKKKRIRNKTSSVYASTVLNGRLMNDKKEWRLVEDQSISE